MIDCKTGLLALAAMILAGNGYAKSNDSEKFAPCTVPIVLKGMVVAEGKPEWSQAQIDDPSAKDSRTFTLKRPWVQSGVRLVEIGEGFVTLEVGKEKVRQRCYSEKHVFSQSVKSKKSNLVNKQVAPAQIEAPAGDIPKSKLKGAIEVLANFPKGGTAAHRKMPKSYGSWQTSNAARPGEAFQLFGLSKKSPLWDLGLRPWDVVRKLNGKKFDDPAKAAEIFSQMADSTERLVIELKRRGKIIEVEYSP